MITADSQPQLDTAESAQLPAQSARVARLASTKETSAPMEALVPPASTQTFTDR